MEQVGSHSAPVVDDQISVIEVDSTSKRQKYSRSGALLADPSEYKSRTSDVWEQFDFIKKPDSRVLYSECKWCFPYVQYKSPGSAGTSNQTKHLLVCKPYQEYVASLPANVVQFDQRMYCKLFAEAILCHGYSLRIVEHEKLRDLHLYLNPKVKHISRNTITKYCMIEYGVTKKRMLDMFSGLVSRVCFTCDLWSSLTTRGYVALTAHYVDNDWKLQSRILNFRHFPPPHNGGTISKFILDLLKEWRLEKKVFSITVDNATSMDSMTSQLQDALNASNSLLCEGKFLHIRCCAHILNLIVQDGLKLVDKSVTKLRDVIKYIEASEGRILSFEESVRYAGSTFRGKLKFDVCTRWNSTFLMLRRALQAKPALVHYCDNSGIPTKLTDYDWEKINAVCNFLEPFYRITNLFSGSKYPTANLYFANIISIDKFLTDSHKDFTSHIFPVASQMQIKFEKYWTDYSIILSIAVMLDPRFKLVFVKQLYGMLYCTADVVSKVEKLCDSFVELYDCYVSTSGLSPSSSSVQSNSTSDYVIPNSSIPRASFTMDDVFENFEETTADATSGRAVLDAYLNVPLEPRNRGEFDVLAYWKGQSVNFPVLALMARDILAIPITSVASESSFSMGGRILDKWRCSLLAKHVEVLVTTRSWLFGFDDDEENVEAPELVSEAELLELDVDVESLPTEDDINPTPVPL